MQRRSSKGRRRRRDEGPGFERLAKVSGEGDEWKTGTPPRSVNVGEVLERRLPKRRVSQSDMGSSTAIVKEMDKKGRNDRPDVVLSCAFLELTLLSPSASRCQD